MDPYRLLGVDRHKITDKQSLEILRQKTKRLWKEHAEKKEQFDCQKVMEAFAMIQKDILLPQQELQRSARERDLDRMYNRQTKEIDKRKKRARQFQSSAERLRMRRKRVHGDRRRESERRRRKRMRIERPKPPPTVASEGLRRLRDILLVPDKFAKAVKLLHRWVSEYCEPSSREYLFEVLAEICDAGTVAQDSMAAKDAIAVFSKVFLDSKEWFARSDLHQKVRKWWAIAAIWNNEIYTDDQFIFTKVITKFEELLEEFVARPAEDEDSDDDGDVSSQDGDSAARATSDQPTLSSSDVASTSDGLRSAPFKIPMVLRSPSPMPLSSAPTNERSSDEGEDDPLDDLALHPDVKNCKEEVKRENVDAEQVKDERGKAHIAKREDGEGKREDDGWTKREGRKMELGEAEDRKTEDVKREKMEEDFDEPEFTYMLLSAAEMFDRMRDHFIIGLESLHKKRHMLPWCKGQVEQLFQDVYYKRERFTESQQEVITRLQADIKRKHKGMSAIAANTCPLRAHVPVVDGRDTVSIGMSGDQVWTAKQWTR